MKLLFVHDHPFYKDCSENLVYSGGSFPNSVWKNYLQNFNKLTVYGRKSKKATSKVVLSSVENDCVKFELTENYDSLPNLLKNYRALKKELSLIIDEADVVLVRLPSVLGVIAARLAYSKNKKVWIEVVGNAKEALNSHGSIMGKLYAPFFNVLNKSIVKKANYVSYVTLSKLQIDYPHSKDAITASLSNVILNRMVKPEDIIKSRFTSKIFKIGLIGGFNTAYKGQDVLLKSIDALPVEIKNNIELYFIGIGESDWIYKLAKELNLENNIKFIGSKPSGEPVLELLEKLSLYVQPSFTEGMPRALLEAMSMGCPVMGSRVGGIPDVVSEELLHNKGDYQTIANQLEKLYLSRQILIEESLRSLKVVKPYLKINLDIKREEFYKKMNKHLLNA